VAFYILNSGSNVTTPSIPVLVLAEIVKAELATIQRALGNRTIFQVQRMFAYPESTTAKPEPKNAQRSERWKPVVIGVCLGLFVLIVVTIILVVFIR